MVRKLRFYGLAACHPTARMPRYAMENCISAALGSQWMMILGTGAKLM